MAEHPFSRTTFFTSYNDFYFIHPYQNNPSDHYLTAMENFIGNPQKRSVEDEWEVSTELTLSCDFSRTKKHKTETNSFCNTVLDSSSSTSRKVSTELKLSDVSESTDCNYNALQEQDPWKIRKKLVVSDISTRCRLVVPTSMVKQYILPFLTNAAVEEVGKSGAAIDVWDMNTKTKHSLVLKQRMNSNYCSSYIFIGGWKQNFVNRRSLKKGDEIGLCWDHCYLRLIFSVLGRNPANQVENEGFPFSY